MTVRATNCQTFKMASTFMALNLMVYTCTNLRELTLPATTAVLKWPGKLCLLNFIARYLLILNYMFIVYWFGEGVLATLSCGRIPWLIIHAHRLTECLNVYACLFTVTFDCLSLSVHASGVVYVLCVSCFSAGVPHAAAVSQPTLPGPLTHRSVWLCVQRVRASLASDIMNICSFQNHTFEYIFVHVYAWRSVGHDPGFAHVLS